MQDQQPGLDIPYYSAPPIQGQESYGMAPIVEQEEGWGKIGIAMVSLALIFAGGVAYFIATSGEDELEVASAQSPSVVEATAPVVTPDAGPKSAAELQAPEPTSAAEETRQALLDGASADAGAAAVSVDASTASAASGPLRANGEVDRPAGLVSLSLESEPPGADVIRKQDGVRLGKTPYLYETEAVPGSVQFVLQLEGYKSMSLSLPSDRDGVRQIMLLPGKGGPPIPAAREPVQAPPGKKEPVKESKKAARADTGQSARPKPERKKTEPKKTEPKKTEPKKTEPKKTTKPRGGRVDYNADPIPLD